MDRILYLFLYEHFKAEVPYLKTDDSHAHRQWAWIDNEIQNLSAPNRVYRDSVTPEYWKQIMIGIILERVGPPTDLTAMEKTMFQLID